jgi:transcriptional regulator with XRE-family HTH domain
MKLDQYLSARKLTDAAFAAIVGMSQSQVNRLRRGLSMPSWDAVAAIEQATSGKVSATDFIPAPARKEDAQ